MTERLYYRDCYLREFEARVIAAGGDRVYLDRTAFYPTSGGQPHDLGTLGDVEILDVIDEGERIAHVVSRPLEPGAGVRGAIDWQRREDHMQQHTGQHLLSAVLAQLGKAATLSFHLGRDYSTIEVDAAEIDLDAAEERANRTIWENHPVSIGFESAAEGLRKPSARDGELRIVSIGDLDRSACGGTHVRSTGEIGMILLGATEKIRGHLRIEFVCGMRALRRARADHRSMMRIARAFSAPAADTPELVESHLANAAQIEKARRKLALELAVREGRELYASGSRNMMVRGPVTEEARARAQGFVEGSGAVYLAVSEDPPALLYAVSKDSGIDAGARLKQAVTAAGGRGGGNAALGQGSVPDAAALEQAIRALGFGEQPVGAA